MTTSFQNGIVGGVSIRLKQLAISIIVIFLRFVRISLRGIRWLMLLALNPFIVVITFAFKPLVVFVYRLYLRGIARLKRSHFFNNKVFFIFGHKYLIHVIVLSLSIFVASANVIEAKKVYDEDFGTKSALYEVVAADSDFTTEIVEKGLPTAADAQSYYIDTNGVLLATVPRIDPQAQRLQTIEEELQLLESGAALTSSTVLDTEVGIRNGFVEYKVKEGDSVGSLANRFGLTVNSILWANNLTSKSYIKPGDTLQMPAYSGYTVEVKDGDTLKKLVEKHKGNFDETLKALDGEELIPVGTKIVIVDGEPYVPPPPVQTSTSYASVGSGNLFQNRNLPAGVTGGSLNWPVGCRSAATTYYGHGLARDIACPSGTPIYAAEAGTAYIRNSGGYGGGYGNYVDVVHAGGMTTRYAHMSAFNITSGQAVSRGQVIGFVGSTGRSSGPHVHFEVHINGVRQEPLNYIR